MEIIKIETPFSSVLVFKGRADAYDADLCAELKTIHRADLIFISPALENDIRLECQKEKDVKNPKIWYTVCTYLCRVIGYPAGEYEIATESGLQILKIPGKNGKILTRPIEYTLFSEELFTCESGRTVFFDAMTGDGLIRVVLCNRSDLFDIDKLGRALIRHRGIYGLPEGLSVISPGAKNSDKCFELCSKNRKEEKTCLSPGHFAACAGLAFRATSQSEIFFKSPYGAVFAVKNGADSAVLHTDSIRLSRLII